MYKLQFSLEKIEKAFLNVQETQRDLNETKPEAKLQQQKAATAEPLKTFKREFDHDTYELGKAFKDLTIDNKK